MCVLLINPWIHDFAAYDYWLKPYGLLSIAALLRESNFRVQVIDCLDRYHPRMRWGKRPQGDRGFGHGQYLKQQIKKPLQLASVPRRYGRYGIPPEIFMQELQDISHSPEAILMTTGMTYWYPGVMDAMKIVREVFPDAPIIIGGTYVTLCPLHAVTLGADYVLSGHAERKVLGLLHDLTGTEVPLLPDNDNLDALPYPAFDLLSERGYVCIQTSRGCPFRCSYCASHLLDQGISRQSPQRVVREIEHWVREYGIRNIVFYDDALLFDPEEHIMPILDGVLERGLEGISLHTPNGLHARFVTRELAQLMFRAGFKTIRLGYETANTVRQDLTGGKVRDEELEMALHHFAEAGFSAADLGVYILTGLPGQHVKEVEASIHRVASLGGVPVLAEFSPIPGTPVWEEAVHYSRFALEHDPLFHNNSIFPCAWEHFTWQDHLDIKGIANTVRRSIIEGSYTSSCH